MTYVFKICPAEIWAEAEQKGVFTGAGIDLTDGFIHFSTAEQVAETAFLHFNAIGGLVLVAVPVDAIDLVWEPSIGGWRLKGMRVPFIISGRYCQPSPWCRC